MKQLIAAVIVCLAASGLVTGQDWRSDADNEFEYNCELVNTLAQAAGAEGLMRTEAGDQQSLAEFLAYVFPGCERQGSPRLAELIESEAEEWIVALYDRVSHEWGEPECSILIDDFYDTGFTVLIGGHALDGVAVDVYFPDDKQAETMDRVINDVMESGTPIRIERIEGDEFPLGVYVFEVHIDYATYPFMWERSDRAMNTVSLSCLGRDALSDAAQRRGEIKREDRHTLLDGEAQQWGEPECSIMVSDDFDGEFNVIIEGHGQDGLAVDVFVPGAGQALKMDQILYDVRKEFHIGVTEGPLPHRAEWKWGDFPLGEYEFDVHIDDEVFRFKWQRGDPSFNTLNLVCLGRAAGNDAQRRLKDAEKFLISDTGCTVGNYAWGDDFSLAIFTEDQDGVDLDIVFPGESEAKATGQVDRGELEDGTPYRVKWIDGASYSKGVYRLLITIGERDFTYEWDRQRRDFMSAFVSC